MKILLINNCHYRRGGADVVYLNTGKLLEKMGHQVIYFSQKSSRNEQCSSESGFINELNYLELSPFKKIFFSLRFFYSRESKKKLEKILRLYKPDIAHIHQYKGSLTPSILITLKRFNIPTVFTLHDYQLLCPYVSFLNGKNEICDVCLTRSTINCIINKCNHNKLSYSIISYFEFNFNKIFVPPNKYFSKLICVSKFGYMKHNGKNKFKSKLVHLYNFFPGLNETIPDYDKGEYILFYGRLVVSKGVQTLIKAWQMKKRNIMLKIVGEGPLFNELKKMQMTCFDSNIELLGFKQGDELSKLIKSASFIIVPSECFENNPLTIIEAYAYGKPVVGSRVGGIPEIINDEQTGYLFNPNDMNGLSEIISRIEDMNKDEYSLMAKSARKYCESHFSEHTHYEKLINIYNNSISEALSITKR